MDPNNQNPQVGDPGLAKLEQDLKTLNNQVDQTAQQPQQPVVVNNSPAMPASPVQPVQASAANITNNTVSQEVRSQNIPHGFPTAVHTTPALGPQEIPPQPLEQKPESNNTSEPNPAFAAGGAGATTPPLPHETKKSNLVLTIAFVLMAVAVLAAVAYVVGNSFTSKKSQDKSAENAPVATPDNNQQSASPSASALQTVAPDSSPSATTETAAQIEIKDFKFNEGVKVKAGATVTFVNNDTVSHSVTADDGSFGTEVIAPGQKITFTAPAKAGSYKFHCSPHPTLTGTLVVEAVLGS